MSFTHSDMFRAFGSLEKLGTANFIEYYFFWHIYNFELFRFNLKYCRHSISSVRLSFCIFICWPDCQFVRLSVSLFVGLIVSFLDCQLLRLSGPFVLVNCTSILYVYPPFESVCSSTEMMYRYVNEWLYTSIFMYFSWYY